MAGAFPNFSHVKLRIYCLSTLRLPVAANLAMNAAANSAARGSDMEGKSHIFFIKYSAHYFSEASVRRISLLG